MGLTIRPWEPPCPGKATMALIALKHMHFLLGEGDGDAFRIQAVFDQFWQGQTNGQTRRPQYRNQRRRLHAQAI